MQISFRFFWGLPLGLLLGVALFVGLLYSELGITNSNALWPKFLIDKKCSMASKMQGPKLLLVGGAGTLFGLSARTVQEETGYPTINLGTHAGLGSAYILYLTEKTAQPGDTVLLVLEYELYEDLYPAAFADNYVLAADSSYFRQLSWQEKLQMAVRVPYKRLDVTKRKSFTDFSFDPNHVDVYTLGGETIDEFGDEIYNRDPKGPVPDSKKTCDPLQKGFSPENKPFTNVLAFCQWAQAHHVKVLATFPNLIYQPAWDQPTALKTFQEIKDFYASQNIPVLGNPQDSLLQADQFFDNRYHLTHAAAIERTKRLVPYLRPYLALPAGSK